jgi:hypothetical protein
MAKLLNPFDAEVLLDCDPSVYVYSKEDVGVMSEIKPELTVLPADKPKELTGWTCSCVNGAEVFFLTPEGDVIEEPITDRDALKEGMKVSAWGGIWTVQKKEDTLFLDAPRSFGTLTFGEDDRNCWACGAIINKRLTNPPKKISIVG